ncbi:hypothetical protein [Saccharothrix sp. ALI-22-I]|uniref:hypothetical protein n=1 Tax=Saccharothrix sp. ALI-22-I TaxID=1933778 RepID=UPI0015C3B108|nr:hypothetical protein [Saccharothrix sp. ALI-22-I]
MSFRSMVVRHICRKLTVLLAGAALVTACADDPREYPGSTGDHSLDELSAHFALDLPSCEITDLRYADTGGPMSSGLYLTYGFPSTCLDSVLQSNHVAASTKAPDWAVISRSPQAWSRSTDGRSRKRRTTTPT